MRRDRYPQVSSTANQNDGDALVGTTIGESYRIVRVVGQGGMGTVYEARHERIATRRFAVKTLHAEFLRDAGAVARFKREAEAAASITSPHVVGVFDVGSTEDGVPYIVGEFLDGEDLSDCLKRVGRLPTPAMVRIVRQICKGLTAAHARGVVHRDVKPENVFLTGDPAHPTARVLDFGISRVETGGTQLTKTGTIMGTPAYMAPEQARGQDVDERADIYSTAAVLYRGLTGSVPLDRPDPPSMIAALLLDEPPPARSLEPSIDEALELILQRAMTKDPAKRYRSIQELDDALAPYDTELDLPAVTMVVSQGSAPRARPGQNSTADLSGQAADVKHARPLLVLYLSLAVCTGLVAVWTIGGVLAAFVRGGTPRATLTLSESGLLVLIACLIAATPGFLLVRHVRAMWHSTMKVLQAMETARATMQAALLAYGGVWLVIRTVEAALGYERAAAWPGWDVLLLVAALLAGAVTLLRKRAGAEANTRTLALPSPIGATVGALLLLLLTALVGVSVGDIEDIAFADEEETEDESPKERVTASAKSRRASPALLSSAQAGGVTALAKLSEKFPNDAAVLEALALAQAGSKQSRVAALNTIERLLELDRKASNNPAIEQVLRSAAAGPPAENHAAFSIMGTKMGSRGPDLLYELSAKPSLKKRADAKLAELLVVEKASPALRVALGLRAAKSCVAVAALLDGAAQEGDKRSIPLLQRQVATRTKKCGFLGLKRCRSKAKCAAQAHAINKAVVAIRAREPK